MNENHEQTGDATYTCNFGTVSLDLPFAQQPALQRFLDVPPSEEGRLISDKLLQRFLSISECVIRQELASENPRQVLKELHVGYELWKALPTGADFHDRKPEDLEQSRWVGLNKIGRMKLQLDAPTSTTMLQIVEQLIRRCQEEALHRTNSELLISKSFYILIYGKRFSEVRMEMINFQPIFGVSSCVCPGLRPGVDGCCTSIC